jgi:hypothetical protein
MEMRVYAELACKHKQEVDNFLTYFDSDAVLFYLVNLIGAMIKETHHPYTERLLDELVSDNEKLIEFKQIIISIRRSDKIDEVI